MDSVAVRPIALLITSLIVWGLACSTTTRGTPFDADRIGWIKRGETTESQVRRWFGEPTSVRVHSSGRSTWTYEHEKSTRRDTRLVTRIGQWIAGLLGFWAPIPPLGAAYETTEREELSLQFDGQGRVHEYEYSRRQLPERRVN